MNKNTTSIYLTVILSLFSNFFGHSQTWKPQTWSNSCWAAATENVFSRRFLDSTKNVGECKLVRFKGGSATDWCTPAARTRTATMLAVTSRSEYANIIKGYASFSYLKNGNQTLAWSILSNLKKPIIFSMDLENSNTNHFVNIYHAKALGTSKWLYVFDPLPTKIGTHYLKNYLAYQLPTQNPSMGLQTTYYNFGKKTYVTTTGHTRYQATISTGIPSRASIYSASTTVIAQFSGVFEEAKRDLVAQEITGFERIPLALIVMGLPAISVTSFRKNTSRTDSLSVLVSESRSQIIPIFSDNSGRLKSVSLLVLLRKSAETADSNLVVWDRIQRLNLPDTVITKLNLPAIGETVNGVRTIKISKELLEFIDTENGGLYLKKGDEYLNILEQNPTWIPLNDFYREIGQVSRSSQPTVFDRTIINSSQFSTVLREKGFDVQVQNGVDVVKWNNNFIKVTDLQQQLQVAPANQNVKQIILFDKRN